jgi:hypothetical protein
VLEAHLLDRLGVRAHASGVGSNLGLGEDNSDLHG